MRQAINAGWFLWRHRHHDMEAHVTPITFLNPLTRGQKVGIKCNTCRPPDGCLDNIYGWGHIIVLKR